MATVSSTTPAAVLPIPWVTTTTSANCITALTAKPPSATPPARASRRCAAGGAGSVVAELSTFLTIHGVPRILKRMAGWHAGRTRTTPMPDTTAATTPILVTGMPRSGTTWVATMLAATHRVVYINEPLNPQHPPGGSPGVLNVRITNRFQYITDANADAYTAAYADLLALRYRMGLEV